MGYLHILNTYKDKSILLFKECYALEKLHGTSTHINWSNEQLTFFSGGESYTKFCGLFNVEELTQKFKDKFGPDTAIIYGEVYGGSQQGMSETYGKSLKFIVFDVMENDRFLDVPEAEKIALDFGLEFVSYCLIPATIEAIDAERDKPSVQAVRNGITISKPREGVVLRPLKEMQDRFGNRIISKHKGAEFAERENVPSIDMGKQKILDDAKAVADEWVNAVRLDHVLDKLGNPTELKDTGKVMNAMVEDVMREAEGEILDTKEIRKAIGTKASVLFKNRVTKV